jgi:hypothetical protein
VDGEARVSVEPLTHLRMLVDGKDRETAVARGQG